MRVLSSEGAQGRKEGGKVAIMLEKSNGEHKALDGGRKEEKNGNVWDILATERCHSQRRSWATQQMGVPVAGFLKMRE